MTPDQPPPAATAEPPEVDGRHRDIAEDRLLIRRIARGDRQALSALYDRHAAALSRLGRRFFDAEATVEDVLHDVFVEAWQRAGDYDPGRGTVAAWLAVRMRSRSLDRLRRDRKRVLSDDPARAHAQRQAPTDPTRTPLALGGDAARALSALDDLSDGEKSVVLALYFSDLSSSEAAASLGIPIGTVKSRVRSAMQKLRHKLRVEVR